MKDYWHNPCPQCGRPKYYSSKLCLVCRASQAEKKSTKHQKEPCPQCGRPKLLTSQLCRACKAGKDIAFAAGRERNKTDLPSPDWSRATRPFLLQFTGIFLSEGSVHARLSQVQTLSFSLAIKLRLDDRPCLEAIQAVLGGGIGEEHAEGQNPCAIWYITKGPDIRAILQAIRPLVLIPMRKAQEFDVALEYFAWRESVGFHNVDRSKIAEFHERLKRMKQLDA